MKAWSLLLLLAGCGSIPQDPAGTLERVRGSRVVRVGVVAGDTGAAWKPLLSRVEHATRARARYEQDALEPLLLRLEEGKLDLVVGGAFAADTPWAERVALGPVLRAEGRSERHVVARNGENAWIMLVEHEARALGHGT